MNIFFHYKFVCKSGSSDEMVSLWRVASCSSAPWLGETTESTGNHRDDNSNETYRGAYADYFDQLKQEHNKSYNKLQVEN